MNDKEMFNSMQPHKNAEVDNTKCRYTEQQNLHSLSKTSSL